MSQKIASFVLVFLSLSKQNLIEENVGQEAKISWIKKQAGKGFTGNFLLNFSFSQFDLKFKIMKILKLNIGSVVKMTLFIHTINVLHFYVNTCSFGEITKRSCWEVCNWR